VRMGNDVSEQFELLSGDRANVAQGRSQMQSSTSRRRVANGDNCPQTNGRTVVAF